ncbi:MAG: hypothetical protein Q9221_000148 [Calogaya cf. arnoldii]
MHPYMFKYRNIGLATVVCYTAPETGPQFSVPPGFQRQVSSGHITLRQLPSNIAFTDPGRAQVNEFLTSAELYHNLAPYKHLLFFQTDSILCANSPRLVKDFLGYDSVGASIGPIHGHGMNGGLSIRNRGKLLEVLDRNTYIKGVWGDMQWENQWFIDKLNKLPLGPNNETGANLPTPEVTGGGWEVLGGNHVARSTVRVASGWEISCDQKPHQRIGALVPGFKLATPKAMLV